jgi:hypothetical protein
MYIYIYVYVCIYKPMHQVTVGGQMVANWKSSMWQDRAHCNMWISANIPQWEAAAKLEWSVIYNIDVIKWKMKI